MLSNVNDIAKETVNLLISKKLTVATAESCTGGLIAGSITSVSGASEVFETGIVSYANKTKENLLNVKKEVLDTLGAVSQETAKEMAEGVLKLANSSVSVSVTGIAGPNGGTKEKPVGLVYIGVSGKNGTKVTKNNFDGNRESVRTQTIIKALSMVNEYVKNNY